MTTAQTSPDTIGLPLSDEVIPDETVAIDEVETAVDEGVESPDDAAVETPDADPSLFEEYDLDELAKTDPKLKAFFDKASDWGKARAEKSYNDRLENAKREAEAKAQQEAISAEYNKALETARNLLGGKAASDLDAILRHVAENGMPNGFDPKAFSGKMATDLFNSTQVAVALQLADDRNKMLAERYPNYQFSQEAVSEWTTALQRRDPQLMDKAFLRAADEAARAAVKAESEAEANAKAAEEAKAKDKAKELREVEATRNTQARPTRDAPAVGGRLTTPEDLEKISSNEWLRKPQEERDRMMREAQQVEERRRQRARGA